MMIRSFVFAALALTSSASFAMSPAPELKVEECQARGDRVSQEAPYLFSIPLDLPSDTQAVVEALQNLETLQVAQTFDFEALQLYVVTFKPNVKATGEKYTDADVRAELEALAVKLSGVYDGAFSCNSIVGPAPKAGGTN